MAIDEQLTIIREELTFLRGETAEIKTDGKRTLLETQKTNGRVTKLEDAHNETKVDLAVLKGVLHEKINVLDRDLGGISPKVEKNQSFIDKLTGSWQAIALVGMIVFEIVKSLS